MPFTIDCSGRRALVTGAGQHTGRAFALGLGEAGATVLVNDIVADKAQAVVDEIIAAGGRAEPLLCDVTDWSAVSSTIGASGADILVNNVGDTSAMLRGVPPPLVETDPASWKPFFDVNTFGVMHCTKAVLPHMIAQEWGRIVTVISDAARAGDARMAPYAGAKAAAAGFMRSMASEVGRYGITANCIALGTIQYPWQDPEDPEAARQRMRGYAIRRSGQVTDLVGMVVLLASDRASWITGQTIPINGGYSYAL